MEINKEDRFECEVDFSSLSSYGSLTWLVRPCEWYLQEYKDCKSIRGRVHQYFISGKLESCDTNRDDYHNCSNFRKTKDPEYLNKVIYSELAKKDARFALTKANTVWEYRSSPPEDWSKPITNANCNY